MQKSIFFWKLWICSICFLSTNHLEAADMEYVAENIVLKDVSGNLHIIDQYLEDGVSVILNFSSTWCKPCWKYERRGVLDVVYNAFGPDGSNEVVVLFLEADPNTDDDCLYGQEGCNDFSYGNWTKKAYPTISLNHSGLFLNRTYKVDRFPSIIGLSAKDRSIHKMGQITLRNWRKWIELQSRPIAQSSITPLGINNLIAKSNADAIITRKLFQKLPDINSLDLISDLHPQISVDVYPNPCAETVYIELPEHVLDARYTILDRKGRKVFGVHGGDLHPGKNKVPVSNLPTGMYTVSVSTKHSSLDNKFLVVN